MGPSCGQSRLIIPCYWGKTILCLYPIPSESRGFLCGNRYSSQTHMSTRQCYSYCFRMPLSLDLCSSFIHMCCSLLSWILVGDYWVSLEFFAQLSLLWYNVLQTRITVLCCKLSYYACACVHIHIYIYQPDFIFHLFVLSGGKQIQSYYSILVSSRCLLTLTYLISTSF